jgi:hypothetical protein
MRNNNQTNAGSAPSFSGSKASLEKLKKATNDRGGLDQRKKSNKVPISE